MKIRRRIIAAAVSVAIVCLIVAGIRAWRGTAPAAPSARTAQIETLAPVNVYPSAAQLRAVQSGQAPPLANG